MSRFTVGGALCVFALLGGCSGAPEKPARVSDFNGSAFGLGVAAQTLPASRARVVMAALSQVGTPYVYGGTAPGRALDCSGLTQYAHRAAGVTIPRVSTAQRAAAKPVSGGRVQPGDLVFFKTGLRQYHVGVVVDGDRFVHASTSKKRVRVSRLSSDYWRRHYIGAGSYLL